MERHVPATAPDTAAFVWQGTLATCVRQVGLHSISMNGNIYTCIHIFMYPTREKDNCVPICGLSLFDATI